MSAEDNLSHEQFRELPKDDSKNTEHNPRGRVPPPFISYDVPQQAGWEENDEY